MTSKETALKVAEHNLSQIKLMFPWADVSTDSIEGRSFYVFHNPENSWNRITYNYTFDTPLNSSVAIHIYSDSDNNSPTVYCVYTKDYGNRQVKLSGKMIDGVFNENATIIEQLANIRLLLVKRKV